jgi:hypothetical protein
VAATNTLTDLILAWRPPLWLQRADTMLARAAAVNASRAVAAERARRDQWRQDAEIVLVEVLPRPRRAAS